MLLAFRKLYMMFFVVQRLFDLSCFTIINHSNINDAIVPIHRGGISLIQGSFRGYSPPRGMLGVEIPWARGEDGVENPIVMGTKFHSYRLMIEKKNH